MKKTNVTMRLTEAPGDGKFTKPKYGTVMSTSNIESFYQAEGENKAKFNRQVQVQSR